MYAVIKYGRKEKEIDNVKETKNAKHLEYDHTVVDMQCSSMGVHSEKLVMHILRYSYYANLF